MQKQFQTDMATQNQQQRTPAFAHDVEKAVLERYQAGAKQPEASLCCPTEYESDYLTILPSEIVEKDYGCGDPTRYADVGETVVDLGSGAGKNCYILAQKVGATGKVIGVDFNEEMLALARKYQDEIAGKLGYRNVAFVKAKIQDLKLNLDQLQAWLSTHPVTSIDDLVALEAERDRLRTQQPLIPDESIDVVVSNCVLNLVRPQDKQQLFQEIYRILKPGGRAVISDIVSDEDPTPEMINDPQLWSGCISGAFREDTFLETFAEAGFYGVEILQRQSEPWQVVNGIEFRSMTVRAFKGQADEGKDTHHAVIYKGPWQKVCDEGGRIFYRGQRRAVSDRIYHRLTAPESPYAQDFIPVPPIDEVPLAAAKDFDEQRSPLRHPRETKGVQDRRTQTNNSSRCCG